MPRSRHAAKVERPEVPRLFVASRPRGIAASRL
jgi:hypothetical protein